MDKVGINCIAEITDEQSKNIFLSFLYSLKAQTFTNWFCFIFHNGPLFCPFSDLYHHWSDDFRFYWESSQHRSMDTGHCYRQYCMQKLLDYQPDWFLLTWHDCFYLPEFLDLMIKEANKSKADIIYCDYLSKKFRWRPFQTKFNKNKIDLGCVLIKSSIAQTEKFTGTEYGSEWLWLRKFRNKKRIKIRKLSNCLLYSY